MQTTYLLLLNLPNNLNLFNTIFNNNRNLFNSGVADYLGSILKDTQVDDLKINGVHGHFIYSKSFVPI
jgi:hypothetical protein